MIHCNKNWYHDDTRQTKNCQHSIMVIPRWYWYHITDDTLIVPLELGTISNRLGKYLFMMLKLRPFVPRNAISHFYSRHLSEFCLSYFTIAQFCKSFYGCNLQMLVQGILKGEVSLYRWPLVWLVWNQLYDNWQFLF